jgi:Putative zinc- or iron-chelating domain
MSAVPRPAGSAAAFIRQYRRDVLATGEVSTPCAGCDACCRTPRFRVELTADEAKRHVGAYQDLGQWWLPRKPDGSCVYLEGGRCSIYADRPAACRVYDCRWQLLFGWRDPDNPVMNAALAEWTEFTTETAADAATLWAVRAAVAAGDGPANTSEEAVRRAQRWRDYLEAVP